jgi:hypothetical protein
LTDQMESGDPATSSYDHVRRDIERTMDGIDKMCAAAAVRFEDFDLSTRRSMVRLSGSSPAMVVDVCTVLAQIRAAALRGDSIGRGADPTA